MIYKLDFPQPPQHVISYILHEQWYLNQPESSGRELNNFSLPIADYHYRMYGSESPIYNDLNKLYSPIFNEDIEIAVLVFINTGSSVASAKYKSSAINYIVTPGGSDVTTLLYDRRRTTSDLSKAEYAFVLPEREWVMFDNQQVHSVKNIQHTRILLSVNGKSNRSFSDLRPILENKMTPLKNIV